MAFLEHFTACISEHRNVENQYKTINHVSWVLGPIIIHVNFLIAIVPLQGIFRGIFWKGIYQRCSSGLCSWVCIDDSQQLLMASTECFVHRGPLILIETAGVATRFQQRLDNLCAKTAQCVAVCQAVCNGASVVCQVVCKV